MVSSVATNITPQPKAASFSQFVWTRLDIDMWSLRKTPIVLILRALAYKSHTYPSLVVQHNVLDAQPSNFGPKGMDRMEEDLTLQNAWGARPLPIPRNAHELRKRLPMPWMRAALAKTN